MAVRRRSILVSLFTRIAMVLAALSLVAAAFATGYARSQVDDAFDGQLVIAANVLRALMTDNVRELKDGSPELSVDDEPLIADEDREAFDNYADWRMFRIWLRGKLVLRSDTGPALAPSAAAGFVDVVESGHKWRVYTLRIPRDDMTVQVGERLGVRDALIRGIGAELILPLVLLVPAVAGLILWSLMGGLKDIRAFVVEVGRKSAKDLAPLPDAAWPRELSPLIRSVNGLLARIEQSLQHERRFIDLAAHQLRTPLAAVKLQAQMIARESDPSQRSAMIARLSAGVDRAAALSDRLLTLARLESAVEAKGEADLKDEAAASLTQFAQVAAARGVQLVFEESESAPLKADPMILRLVIDNLLENAVRHAPAGSEVSLSVLSDLGETRLEVMDAGPGIPLADRARVVERFDRGSSPQGEGAGLGLSIVLEALRILGGRLDLLDRADGAPGLLARVSLPFAQSESAETN